MLTLANLQVFARVGNGRTPIKQGNNFAFNGVDRIDFENADSTLHFFFPQDNAYAVADSANRINVTRVFSSQRGKDYVLVGVPYTWLEAAPKGTLVIDPTTTASASDDVWLEGTLNNGSSTQFLIGKAAGFAKKRTLIKFTTSGVTPSATVLNAQMKLYYYTANGGSGGSWVDRWVQAHQVLVNWNEAQATRDNRLTSTPWNVQYVGLNDIDAKSGYESTMLFQTGQTGTWKIWDLTALTQKWVNLSASNYGVVLWATNEATDGYDLRFYSSEYTVDPTKVPKLEIIYSQQAKTVYFLKDHLGSIRATVQDTTGAPVRGYDDYDPWGYILAGRSLASSVLPVATRNRFTGKERDDEFSVNWDYFGARYYDAQIGRWMSVDPLRNSLEPNQLVNVRDFYFSPYAYALDNPVVLIDPHGNVVITAQASARILAGGTFSIAYGVAVDLKGNVGLFRTVTAGLGGGIGVGAGLSVSAFPFAQTIDEINGVGGALGAFAGLGVDFLEAESNVSLQTNEQGGIDDFRLGLTFGGIPYTGAGIGIGAFAEGSLTQFLSTTTVSEILEGADKTIKQIARKLNLKEDEAVALVQQLQEAIRQREEEERKRKESEEEKE